MDDPTNIDLSLNKILEKYDVDKASSIRSEFQSLRELIEEFNGLAEQDPKDVKEIERVSNEMEEKTKEILQSFEYSDRITIVNQYLAMFIRQIIYNISYHGEVYIPVGSPEEKAE